LNEALVVFKAATTHTLKVTNAGWATLYLNFPAEIPTFTGEEAKEYGAYIVTGVKEDNWLQLKKVEGVLPAKTGILFKANAGDYTFAYSADEVADVAGNLLEGSVTEKNVEGEAYVLGYINEEGAPAEVGFGKAVLNKDAKGDEGTTHFKNNANKAYLPASVASGAASYSFRFGEGTTAIENVEVENEVKTIYDLTGRKLKGENGNLKGIYIINGKKVLVK
jgi:hypothetical protein